MGQPVKYRVFKNRSDASDAKSSSRIGTRDRSSSSSCLKLSISGSDAAEAFVPSKNNCLSPLFLANTFNPSSPTAVNEKSSHSRFLQPANRARPVSAMLVRQNERFLSRVGSGVSARSASVMFK